MLRVPAAVLEQVARAAEAAYPQECCGLLIGPIPPDFDRPGREARVLEARPAANGWEESARTRRYAVEALELVRLERELAGSGRGLVGLYHSHPDVPAWPSPFDLERAWPCYSYWIVSVRDGRAAAHRSWTRSGDGAGFIEENVVISKEDTP